MSHSGGAAAPILRLTAAQRAELPRPVVALLAAAPAVQGGTGPLDAALVGRLAAARGSAPSAATVRAYASDWRAFAAWCAALPAPALPADPETVAGYLVAAALTTDPDGGWRYALRSVERQVAAIGAVHAAHGLPNPRTELVRATMLAVRTARPDPGRDAPPIEIHHLRALLAVRPPDGWPGGVARRRDRELLVLGMSAGLRRSEAAALRVSDIVVHRAALDVRVAGAATVTVPAADDPLRCPVCAHLAWLAVLVAQDAGGAGAVRELVTARPRATEGRHQHRPPDGPPDGPLLRPITRHGYLVDAPMSGDAVHQVVRRYVQRAGLPADYRSHSLRAGFAAAASRAGEPSSDIMARGRWRSRSTVGSYRRRATDAQDQP